MAPESRVLFVQGLNMHERGETRIFEANKQIERVLCVVRQFGRQPPPTVRLLCASAPLHTRRSRATRKREDISFIRRDGKMGCTVSSCLPARGIPSPSRLCIISQRAGHRPRGILGLSCPAFLPMWSSPVSSFCVRLRGLAQHAPTFLEHL